MRTQHTAYDCAVLAIKGAAEALGLDITEKSIRPHVGLTKKDGVSHFGVRQGLERIGLIGEELIVAKDNAFESLHEALERGCPIILSVEREAHWAIAFGLIGEGIITFDSWKSKAVKAKNGIDIWYNKKSLFRWWTPSTDGMHYGIIVSKPVKE